MRIRKVTIENFKAIKSATLELSDFTVIVGSNGSGKSSVLTAMHWMFQTGRNPNIEAKTKTTDGAVLSETDATFMPSPNYLGAAHGQDYGNFQGSPQLEMVVDAAADDGEPVSARMWIKAARNQGLSVHVPSSNPFVAKLRDKRREFSAYIPGLAGIPLTEEKRSKLIVRRLAAAGDANTVLRNVLLLLKDVLIEKESGLDLVQKFVSEVMGELSLSVDFDDDKHSLIQATFQTAEMKKADAKRFKPLELAGIGFLQVIQIFAYLVYFRPVILLVDEPDSHLHPTAQERLVTVLAKAARRFDAQVILTTHSPSVIRALSPDARVVWMRNGQSVPSGDTEGRQLMGWGLLDRRIVLMTEDKDSGRIQALLSQWPDLDRHIAIWPFHGSTKLPTPEVVSGLIALTGGSLSAVLHRDRDFLMPLEIAALTKPYSDAGHRIWFSKCSDIEAYWAEPEIVSAHFGVSLEDAQALIHEALSEACLADKALMEFRRKRKDAMDKIKAVGKGELPQYGDGDAEAEAAKHGIQHKVLGKALVAAIRECAQKRGHKSSTTFGKFVPAGLSRPMAEDFEQALRSHLK